MSSDQPSTLIHQPPLWQRARHWTTAAIRFDRCKLACQIMTGFELLALRKASGFTHGGRRIKSEPSSPNPSDLLLTPATAPTTPSTPVNDIPLQPSSPPRTWPGLVRHHLGISDDTARNWMLMADAARPRLKKLGGAEALAQILDKPATEWLPDETTVIETTVHKISDGKTQLDFMRELGLVKLPQGSAAVGGHLPSKNPLKPDPTTTARTHAHAFLRPLILTLFTLRTTHRDLLLHTPLSTQHPAREASLTHLHEELTECLALVKAALETVRRAPPQQIGSA